MADKVEINYETLQEIASKWESESESITRLFQLTRSRVEGLTGSGWMGLGTQAFTQELETQVFPGMQRLVAALIQTSEVTTQLITLFEDAETEASKDFTSTDKENSTQEKSPNTHTGNTTEPKGGEKTGNTEGETQTGNQGGSPVNRENSGEGSGGSNSSENSSSAYPFQGSGVSGAPELGTYNPNRYDGSDDSGVTYGAGGGGGGGGGADWSGDFTPSGIDDLLKRIDFGGTVASGFGEAIKSAGGLASGGVLSGMGKLLEAAGIGGQVVSDLLNPNLDSTQRLATASVDAAYGVTKTIIADLVSSAAAEYVASTGIEAAFAQGITGIGVPTAVATVAAAVAVGATVKIGTGLAVGWVMDQAFLHTGLRETLIDRLGGLFNQVAASTQAAPTASASPTWMGF